MSGPMQQYDLRARAKALTGDQVAAVFSYLSANVPDTLAEALAFVDHVLQDPARAATDLETGLRVLALPLQEQHHTGAATVGGYLIATLRELWTEVDQFSGKYGIGDSDWQYDLYRPLVTAGLIRGTFGGYADDDIDTAEGDRLIHLAITALGHQIGGRP